jgi:hypothetical protein
LTGIPIEGYAFLMGPFVSIICTLLIMVAQANVNEAAEFYSWTDASGAVVITDDPKQVPPDVQRHGFATHQLPNIPPSAATEGRTPSDPVQRNVQASGHPYDTIDRTPRFDSQAKPGKPDSNGPVADILLNQPEGAIQQEYVWVPLQTPFVFGGQTLTGFWSHRRVASPPTAFQAYLRRHGHAVRSEPTTSMNGDPIVTPGSRAGGPVRDPVYEQVRREREAIQQRGGLLYPSAAAPHPSTGLPASNGSGAAHR